MGKTFLSLFSFVWLCQSEAYIQNGFTSGSRYAPIQISSVPEKPSEKSTSPATPPNKKTPALSPARISVPPVVTTAPVTTPQSARPTVAKPAAVQPPPVVALPVVTLPVATRPVAKPPVTMPAAAKPAANPPPTPPVVHAPQPDESTSEVTNNNQTASPITSSPRPQARPATSTGDFRAVATTKALGQTYKGGQVATLLTSCGTLKFGDSGKCEPIKVAKDFVPVLLEQIPKCVNKALGLDHESPAAEIFVTHMGAYTNRTVAGSTQMSMHSTGRALDISKFTIKTKSGKTIVHKMTYENRNDSFYKNFNKCWPTYQGSKAQCRPNGTHVIDCKDPDHRDHVHLSLPFCPKKSGISSW